MRKFYFLVAFWVIGLSILNIDTSSGQIYTAEGLNIPGTWNSWTNPPATNSALGSSTQVTGGKVTQLLTPTTNRYHTTIHAAASGGDVVGGSHSYIFSSGTVGIPYGNKWGNVGTTINSLQSYTCSGVASDNSITLTNDKWYTLNWENKGYVNTRAIFMETSANPVTISAVSQSPAAGLVFNVDVVTVNVTISATKSAEENMYVRYSVDNFVTSSLASVTFFGTSGTATIPAKADGTTVKYYVFSTTISNPTADYDLYTLNFNDNANAFFTYTVVNNPPVISTLSPADNASNFALGDNLQITFNENVAKGTGNITLKKADNTVIETINISSGLVTISGNVVTINPTNNLNFYTNYYVTIDNTAIVDLGAPALSFAGIADATTWNFTSVADLVGWSNIQFPSTATVVKSYSIANVYARVFKSSVTEATGQGSSISAWVGCNSANTDPSTWAESAWIPAVYNTDNGNNDEYKGVITGAGLSAGTYYYASRFQYASNPAQYGGYSASGGGFWNGTTNVSGVLTVQDYPGVIIASAISAITSVPSFPTVGDAITINFDATLGNTALKDLVGNLVYAHTGITTPAGDWQYSSAWLDNNAKYAFTHETGNLYSLSMPNIFTYYGAAIGTDIQKMSFVLRNSDGSKQAKTVDNKDFAIQLYPAGELQVRFNYPSTTILAHAGDQISIEAESNTADQIKLYVDDVEINTVSALKLNYNVPVGNTSGSHVIKAVAIKSGFSNVEKTISYFIVSETAVQDLPVGMKDGINYINGTSVTLVLYAPEKQTVHLIGDFNNWVVDNNYLMKRTPDNMRYWITLTGLTPGTEYAYQYLIDGSIRVADPYADKILDPDNDKYIPSSVYPNLKAYPTGLTTEIASVFQTNQTPYSWAVPNFTAPNQSQLVIYELHIRDFTATGDIQGVFNKLDYLKTLGVNAIELMPINEFEGNDSWGYNPDFYFAPDKAYGTKQAYKAFIDECHKKGIAVIIDMVLNHSFNQSPMVRMYYDATTGKPTANNPWFNVDAPNTSYSWGSDFNHTRQITKDFIDRVNAYWLTEYKVDGMRFDFTKGFTQTGGDGYAYDASRIAILERMYDAIKAVNPAAYVICEHLADGGEEAALANHGLMLWGNMNVKYSQASMGWNSSSASNVASAYFKNKSFTYANLISYAQSHDEERNAFEAKEYGNSTQSPTYDVKAKATYVNRTAATEAFNLFMPGPRMLWQFEELAYDYSINENGRTGKKPVRWDYFDDVDRKALYTKMAKMIKYRIQNPTIFKWQIDYYETPDLKRIRYIDPDVSGRINAVIIANFGVTSGSILPAFGVDGLSWYDVITSASIGVQNSTGTNQFTLAPGELRIYVREELAPVSPVYPPLGENATVAIDEDINKTFAAADFKFYSVDGKTSAGIKIITTPTAGNLLYDGVNVSANTDYSDVTKLVFQPALNANGTAYSTFTYQLKDNSTPTPLYSENNYSYVINVNPVNDAPVITGQIALVTKAALPITLSMLTVTDVDNTYPTGFSLTVGTGANYTVVGNTITPAVGFEGILSVPVTVNDGAANSTVYNLSVTSAPAILWNGTAWSNGTGPDASKDAIIDGLFVADASFECANLTINAAKQLVINSGRYVKVTGTITNSNGVDGILIKAGGSLLHSTPGILGKAEMTVTGGGITSNASKQWHIISSPVETFAYSPFFTGNTLYTYNESGTTSALAWPITTAAIQPAVGYLFFSPTATTKTFSGAFNQGPFTSSNMSYANVGLNNRGINLVGNPYPSTLDWNSVAITKTNISNTIWVWNPNSYSYGTFDGIAGINGASRYIPACQGFFVEVSSASNTLQFTNAARVSNSQLFLKTASDLTGAIKLKLTDGKYSDEIFVYHSLETGGSAKLYSMSALVPQLYIKEGTNSYAISHYATPVRPRDIPVNIYITVSGKYSLAVQDFTFADDMSVTLEDLKTLTTIDLTATSVYSFDYVKGETSDRFVLHLKAKTATGISNSTEASVRIYTLGKSIYVSSSTSGASGNAAVFDLLGKVIAQKAVNSNAQIDMSAQPAGIYIVKYSEKNTVFTQKVNIQ